MAKEKRTSSNAALKKMEKKRLTKALLISEPSLESTTADITLTFTSGLGQATVTLFRQGMLINMQSVSNSDTVHFSNVASGDAIAINGVCTGSVTIAIDIPTNPTTPSIFSAGNFNVGYDIL